MARNHDKGREAENGVADFLAGHGFPAVERRAKRGGHVEVDGQLLHRDAGDLAGIPGVVVQVKWQQGKRSLSGLLHETELQRRAAGADVGLLVCKRPGTGVARAAEWDAYLPTWQVLALLGVVDPPPVGDLDAPVHVSLATAASWLVREYGAVPYLAVTA